MKYLHVSVFLSVVALFAVGTALHAQTAQDSIEKTLGALMVQNATCVAQGMQLQEELRKVKAELDALKAKPADAK